MLTVFNELTGHTECYMTRRLGSTPLVGRLLPPMKPGLLPDDLSAHENEEG
jgi:hypothetical protein